jgi:uncharacterized OB-fold protein
MIKGAPLPAVTDDSAGFWEGTAAGELRIQRCSNCGRLRFPPRPMCPYCNALDHSWDAMSGRGHIWSFVVPHPPLLPAFMEVAPYNVVVVELDEDPLIRLDYFEVPKYANLWERQCHRLPGLRHAPCLWRGVCWRA